MFQEAIYCPACGARRTRREAGSLQAPCPACRGVMREVQIGDTAFLECERCHGSWLDAGSFEYVCANREAQAAFLHQFTSPPRPAASGEVHYRKCVACGKMMNRINFGRLSGTVVDVCKGHGTFLDAGELHAIVTFIEGGGFDRARQRQIEDMRDEEARLRAAQAVRQSGHAESRSDQRHRSGPVAVDGRAGGDHEQARPEQVGGQHRAQEGEADPQLVAELRADRAQPEGDQRHRRLGPGRSGEHGPRASGHRQLCARRSDAAFPPRTAARAAASNGAHLARRISSRGSRYGNPLA